MAGRRTQGKPVPRKYFRRGTDVQVHRARLVPFEGSARMVWRTEDGKIVPKEEVERR